MYFPGQPQAAEGALNGTISNLRMDVKFFVLNNQNFITWSDVVHGFVHHIMVYTANPSVGFGVTSGRPILFYKRLSMFFYNRNKKTISLTMKECLAVKEGL